MRIQPGLKYYNQFNYEITLVSQREYRNEAILFKVSYL